MPKESKWAKDAQKEINGRQKPASNVVKGPMIILGHRNQLGEEREAGLKEAQRALIK